MLRFIMQGDEREAQGASYLEKLFLSMSFSVKCVK